MLRKWLTGPRHKVLGNGDEDAALRHAPLNGRPLAMTPGDETHLQGLPRRRHEHAHSSQQPRLLQQLRTAPQRHVHVLDPVRRRACALLLQVWTAWPSTRAHPSAPSPVSAVLARIRCFYDTVLGKGSDAGPLVPGAGLALNTLIDYFDLPFQASSAKESGCPNI